MTEDTETLGEQLVTRDEEKRARVVLASAPPIKVVFKEKQIFSTAFATYRPVAQIGEGGAGTVFHVVDDSSKPFALKRLDKAKATSQRMRRFRNELDFCRRGVHPGIVRVLDYGLSTDGAPFYVMPLYPRTLRALMAGGLPPTDILPLFSQTLAALEVAHSMGVVHRDLKPENLLCADDGTIVIADFGIAHFEMDDLATIVNTASGERLASFRYAAPEQRAGNATITPATDVFSLGSILNEMFTGETVHGPGYPRIGSKASSFSFLDLAVEKMVQQDPAERPGTIAEVKRLIRLSEAAPGDGGGVATRAKEDEIGDELIISGVSTVESRTNDAQRRLQREADSLDRTIQTAASKATLMRSEEGAARAAAEVQALLGAIGALSTSLSRPRVPLRFRGADGSATVEAPGVSLGIAWTQLYKNSLDGSSLDVEMWKGGLPGLNRFYRVAPVQIDAAEYLIDLDSDGRMGWRSGGKPITSSQELAEQLISELLQAVKNARGEE